MIPRLTKSTPRLTAASVLALALAATLPMAAGAQSSTDLAAQKTNGPERIDYAGKLKMLTQRIPASACNAAAGIGGWEAKGYLLASIGEFDRIMNALENGDVFISIKTPENDRTVLRRIGQMNDVWHPVRDDVLPIAEQSGQSATVEQVATTTQAAPELLEITQALVGDLIGEYADPSRLLATDAVGLDIMGRQRMMPQIISKSTCMIAEGLNTEAARTELDASIALFELSLEALSNGMPEVGVRPPPTEAIRDGLLDVTARWMTVRPTIEVLMATGTLSSDDREFVYSEMNHLTAMMNEVSRIYAKASTQNL